MPGVFGRVSPAEDFGQWWWKRATTIAVGGLPIAFLYRTFPNFPLWLAGAIALLDTTIFSLWHLSRYRTDAVKASSLTWVVSIAIGPLHSLLLLAYVLAVPYLTGTIMDVILDPFRHSFSAVTVENAQVFIAALIVSAPAAVIGSAPLWLLYELGVRDDRSLALQRAENAALILQTLRNDGHTERFALYLRPFTLTDKLPSQPLAVPIFDDDPDPAHLDFETLLYRALRPRQELIASGWDSDYLGAGRVYLDDQNWRDDIETLSTAASLIILVPAANRGTLWEMTMLRRLALLDRTVFVMPESIDIPSTFSWERRYPGESFYGADNYRPDEHLVDLAMRWQAAQEAASSIALELPPYDPGGLLFTLRQDGSLADQIPLGLMSGSRRVPRLREALERLSPGATTRDSEPPTSTCRR